MRENILILMSDEQRWDTLGFAGNTAARTPHLDRLAERGTVFDRCYTAYPLCCPARASLWTSRMPHNHHVFGNWRAIRPELRDGGPVETFARAGYHTIYTGKWHMPGTTPARLGFTDATAIPTVLQGKDRGRYIAKYRAYAAAQGYALLPQHIENLTQRDLDTLRQPGCAPCGTAEIPLEHFLETWQTTQFLRALGRRPADRPFFAVCSYNAPHFPMIVPAPYDRLIPPESAPLWPNFCAGLDGKPDEVLESHHHTDVAGLGEGEWRRLIAHYLGLCALIDAQVGRVLDHLREAGALENTIVVFTSDHGDMMGSHCLNEKGHVLHYEETLRVPLVIAHPNLGGGRRVEHFASLIDLLPSLAEMAGVALDETIDGASFVSPMMRPDAPPIRDYIVAESFLFDGQQGGSGEYTAPERFDGGRDSVNLSIRTRTHKYIFRWNDRDELYDLSADPYENRNIRDHPDAAAVVKRLRRALAAELQETFPLVRQRLRAAT